MLPGMIRTKKLGFRAIEERDLPLLADMLNDEEMSSLVVGWSFPVSLEQQKQWFARQLADQHNQRWMVETAEGQTIGLTGLWSIDWINRNAMTGLKLAAKDTRGKGYGTDAIMGVMAYAFGQLGFERMWSEILVYNVPSYKAYVEKCGWKVEGISRRAVFRAGEFHDMYQVGILRDEFLALPTAVDYLARTPAARVEVAPQFAALPKLGR
jgi:RimJ/RimL family protein N-acetyltransferase